LKFPGITIQVSFCQKPSIQKGWQIFSKNSEAAAVPDKMFTNTVFTSLRRAEDGRILRETLRAFLTFPPVWDKNAYFC
jgi:hypothetical protein